MTGDTALTFLFVLTRAREGERGDADGPARPARAVWAADGEVYVAAIGDFFLRSLVGADAGARAVWATDDDDGGGAGAR